MSWKLKHITLMNMLTYMLLFILPLNNTLEMIVYSYPISWILTGLLYVLYYFKKRQQFPDTDEPTEA